MAFSSGCSYLSICLLQQRGLAGSCHELRTAESRPSGHQAELSSLPFNKNTSHRAPLPCTVLQPQELAGTHRSLTFCLRASNDSTVQLVKCTLSFCKRLFIYLCSTQPRGRMVFSNWPLGNASLWAQRPEHPQADEVHVCARGGGRL